jgi:hypothetical protein
MKPLFFVIICTSFFSTFNAISQSSSASCDPVFHLEGLYNPAFSNDQEPPIFGDLLKAELISGSFFGKDKEYGDADGDGDIDIFYVTNIDELWYIPNQGSITQPDYNIANRVFTGISNAFSFRLYDWYADNVIDLVVLREDEGVMTISLYLDIESQIGAPQSNAELLEGPQFPLTNGQLIEIGDVDGDLLPELFVSGQGTAINGTAVFSLDSTGWAFPPVFELLVPQTYAEPFFVEEGVSFPSPELFDADCDGDLDLFISDPTWVFEGGGHVEYYENIGGEADYMVFTEISPNPYGLDDIPLPGMELTCDWVVTRFADFFGDGFPEAIAYNPCHANSPNGEMYYYRNALDVTSVNPGKVLEGFTFYPNPATDELAIGWEGSVNEDFSFSVVDCFAREQTINTFRQSSSGINLDVRPLTPGTYFVKVYSEKGIWKVVKFLKV